MNALRFVYRISTLTFYAVCNVTIIFVIIGLRHGFVKL